MAEGFCRHFWADEIECESAGIEKHGLNPDAVEVMQEAGVDITGHRSKTLDDLDSLAFDYVFTVCGSANESCPVFPGQAKVIHHGFDDPPKLAATAASKSEALDHYRRVRDEIKAFVSGLGIKAASF